jgi:hypothetical protein
MKLISPFVGLLLALTGPASAQTMAAKPEVETVTSTASKSVPEKQIHDFVRTYSHQASPVIGKLAQWSRRAPLCPKAVGLSPAFNVFVSDRIRSVAKTVGAPLQTKVTCNPNMVVFFTPHPQALLDTIRHGHPGLLGFHDIAQAESLARVTHPFQAWYATATRNYYGTLMFDSGLTKYIAIPPTGALLDDGLNSEIMAVTVVVDSAKIIGLQLGAVADYISMLALSQTKAFETCQPLASITNLMTPECAASLKSNTLSQYDIAYLTALYRMKPDTIQVAQQSTVADEMKAILNRH